MEKIRRRGGEGGPREFRRQMARESGRISMVRRLGARKQRRGGSKKKGEKVTVLRGRSEKDRIVLPRWGLKRGAPRSNTCGREKNVKKTPGKPGAEKEKTTVVGAATYGTTSSLIEVNHRRERRGWGTSGGSLPTPKKNKFSEPRKGCTNKRRRKGEKFERGW